jgi:hypothetical protein
MASGRCTQTMMAAGRNGRRVNSYLAQVVCFAMSAATSGGADPEGAVAAGACVDGATSRQEMEGIRVPAR